MGLFRRDPPPPPPPVRRVRKVGYTAALTASAKVLVGPGVDPAKKAQKLTVEAWQRDAWNYYDLVGELWYAANFYGGCLSRVILTPGLRGRDGRVGTVWGDEDEEGNPQPLHPWAGPAADLLEDLRSPVGGQAAILRAFGINLAVAGEAYLLGQDDQEVVTSKRWEVLSVEELTKGDGKKYKRGDEEIDPEKSLVTRVWRPHPRKSSKADASTKALAEILEELVILTRGVRATATSRLAGAGVYWVPEEIDYPGENPGDDDAEEAQGKPDPFTADLIKAMVTPISDKGSAASVVPMVVRAPAEYIEKVRFDDFTRSFDSYPSVALRKEAVERFAQGIDLPVEIVTGQGGANHWSAWQIDEQTFKAHIEPMLTLICDALTGGYLHPGLLALGAKPEEIVDLVAHYDATELVTHPNQAADATMAHDRVAIRSATYRRVLGFTEDDAPDEEEIAERLRIATAMRGSGAAAPAGGNTPQATPAGSPSEVEPGTPSTGEATANLAALTAAAAEVAIERAIERAGAKVRGRVNGRREVRDAVAGIESRRVCAQLGPALTAEIIGESDLFVGEFTALGRSVTEWARSEGRPDAPEIAGRVVAVTERLAKGRLYSTERVSVSPADYFEAVTCRA